MADYSQGGIPAPPPMHSGRIPSFKNSHGDNFQNRCSAEPPACVQNAMMTKDKKPFTYTPGGLDLSQIKTPSMARRLNRAQQEKEDSENPAYYRQPSVNGGAPAPPPPPGPPPPPPLVINVLNPPKPPAEGFRPEIVIPENPIGMLRKTRSPYHWEAEQQQDQAPKFVDKKVTPSQQAPQMQMRPQPQQQPPQQFYQQPPQQSPQPGTPQYNNKSPSTSPIWKPEPKYPQSPQQFAGNQSPQNKVQQSPVSQTPTKVTLQRQDSQFNLSPSPWGKESPLSNSSNNSNKPNNEPQNSKSITPVSGGGSPWRQDTRNSPMSPNNQEYRNTPIQVEVRGSPMQAQSPLSPSQSMRSPGMSPYAEQMRNTTPIYNNVPNQQRQENNVCQPEWRQHAQQSPSVQQNRAPQMNNNMQSPGLRYVHPPANFNAANSPQSNDPDSEIRYQSHMTIPVTPRNKGPNEQQVPISQEPAARQMINTSENLPWARSDNANKTTPIPPWCQRAGEGRKSLPNDNETGGNSPAQQPWGQRPTDSRRSAPRDSPGISHSGSVVQPPWLQQENTGYQTLPRAQSAKVPPSPCIPEQLIQHVSGIDSQGRVVPIQMEMSRNEIHQNNQATQNMRGNQPGPQNRQQPQLRIIIGMNQQPGKGGPAQTQGNQQPQQHIMRVVQPHLVRVDGGSMTSPPAQPPQNAQAPRTRIIPIQMEPSSPIVTSPTPRVIYHKINFEGPPRQSRAFKVLQTITGTDDIDTMQNMENNHGFSDL